MQTEFEENGYYVLRGILTEDKVDRLAGPIRAAFANGTYDGFKAEAAYPQPGVYSMGPRVLADNPQLDEWVVHDLNATPRLPFADRHFDAVICTVSVQYMIRPLDIFREVERVLEPGAPFIVSFSNRCFPQKAVALWLAMTDAEHVDLVRSYFGDGWDGVATHRYLPKHADPLFIVWAHRSAD